MQNLVLSSACGLDPKQIEFFIASLRKYYNGEVYVLVNKKDFKIKEILKNFNCRYLEITAHKFDVQVKRYEFYLEIIHKNKFDKILICDSRDIYFQLDPFKYNYKGDISFFLESKKIKDCPYNTNWLMKTYGEKIFKKLSEETINCSGTTLGSYIGIKNYLEQMVKQSKKNKYKKKLKYLLTFRRDKSGRGADQAYSNFIVHNKLIENNFLYSNESGPIATVYYLKEIAFNKYNQLLNSLGEPYNIVHQYDKRWNEFSNVVKKLKMDLNIQ